MSGAGDATCCSSGENRRSGFGYRLEKDAAVKEGEVSHHSRGASPLEGNLGSDRVQPMPIPPKSHLPGADKREATSLPDKKRALASPRQSKFDHGTSSSSPALTSVLRPEILTE